ASAEVGSTATASVVVASKAVSVFLMFPPVFDSVRTPHDEIDRDGGWRVTTDELAHVGSISSSSVYGDRTKPCCAAALRLLRHFTPHSVPVSWKLEKTKRRDASCEL